MEACLTGAVNFHGGAQAAKGRELGNKSPHLALLSSDVLPAAESSWTPEGWSPLT